MVTLLYFVVLLGVLILAHEAGHYAAARAAGVRVERFSIGLGPPLLRLAVGGTELRVGAIPLGGYVRLHDDEDAGERRKGQADSPRSAGDSFTEQPLWRRALILLAGPLMNLLLPPVALFGAALADASGPPAVVGTVFADRPAEAALRPGDRILSIDGHPVHLFEEVARLVAERPGRRIRLEVLRGERPLRLEVTAVPTTVRDEAGRTRRVGRLGIAPFLPLAVVGVRSPRSAAWRAGLRPFDRVVSVDGDPVDDWPALLRTLERRRGRTVTLGVLRPMPLELSSNASVELYAPRLLRLWIPPEPADVRGATGLELAEAYVRDVRRGSPAWRIGLRPGDRIASVNGRPASSWDAFRRLLGSRPADHGPLRLAWWHAGERREASLSPTGPVTPASLGLRGWLPRRMPEASRHPHPLRYAWRYAWRESLELLELTTWAFGELFRGTLPVASVGGPIAVYDAVGEAVDHGPVSYLRVMAFLSINLAFINLLPIPLLDGGQLSIALFEATRGRRLSPRSRTLVSLVGLLILVVIMALLLVNDLHRLWDRLAGTVAL